MVGPVVELVNEGRSRRATDPAFIREQVERLGQGRIAYNNALDALRNSGEYAVPTMLEYLGDPDRRALHGDVRNALTDLGLDALNPLLAATDAQDPELLSQVILVLGEIGYPAAVPHILERLERNPGGQVEQQATRALARIGYTGGSTAAAEYLDQAERFWRNESPIRPDARFPGANAWQWNGQALRADVVPEQIFDEVMSMRHSAKALQLAGDGQQEVQDRALPLYLAGNYRREAELGPGEADPTTPDGTPTAGYYGTQAGVDALQAVIDRAVSERTLPPERRYDAGEVALRAVRSLRKIIGESTLQPGESPLTRAMNFPDRRVRVEAAMALAQALPTVAVSGSEQVVPLLAEGLSQTGEPTVLLVLPDRDALNAASETLGGDGEYRVVGATDASEAFERARALPGVDVLVVDTRLGDSAVADLLSQAGASPKLNGSAKLLLTKAEGGRFEQYAGIDPTVTTSTASPTGDLAAAVAAARDQVGGLPLDELGATELAVTAAELLMDIGLGSSVFSLDTAESQLLAALDDERPDVQRLAARIVALLDGGRPQRALLQKGLSQDSPTEVRVAAFEALAESAKRIGNQLGGDNTERLLEAARSAEDLAVRTAAAESVGALSLPSQQAKTLIIDSVAQ